MTKDVFISIVRTHLASLLNINESRISNLGIRPGSIIVFFSILPANNSDQPSINATVLLLQQLVSGGQINLTLPGLGRVIRVDPNSFQVVPTLTDQPEMTTTPKTESRGDDDDLSTTEIVIIAVVCSLAIVAVIVAFVYYFWRVRPKARGKISPTSSQLELQEQPRKKGPVIKTGVNNNACGT